MLWTETEEALIRSACLSDLGRREGGTVTYGEEGEKEGERRIRLASVFPQGLAV